MRSGGLGGAEQVVARSSVQCRGDSIAPRQRVIEVGADDTLKISDHIAFRMAPMTGIGSQIHPYRRIGARVRQRVRAFAAVQGIPSRSSDERIIATSSEDGIVAVTTGKNVVPAVACERIIVSGTDNPFYAGIDVAFRGAALASPGQIDGNRGAGTRIGHRVHARAAFQRIRAHAADEQIVARAADKMHGLKTGGERIVVRGADDALDGHKRVIVGMPARNFSGGEVDVDRVVGGAVIGKVKAVAAIQGILAHVAAERIVARAAGDEIVARAAVDAIVAGVAR